MAVARALIDVHKQNTKPMNLYDLFWMQKPAVNTAGLLLMAEWRDAETIEMFLKNGADVNGMDSEGFSVLDMFLMGHDGYSSWHPDAFEVLTRYKVRPVTQKWIADECDGAPQFVKDFLATCVFV